MKNIYTITILLIGLLTISWTEIDKNKEVKKKTKGKIEKAKVKASRSFDSFAYTKSIKRYKKVLQLSPDDNEATIKIADSYRKINDSNQAREWYKKAADLGFLVNKADQLNYAQVLSSVGDYEEADKWYNLHGENGKMAVLIKNKKEALKSIELFFKDSVAYNVRITDFNTEHSDFGPSYLEEGIVFASARPSKGLFKPKYAWDNSNFLDMFKVNEKGEAVKIQRGINTRYHEGPATFFDQSNKVIFTRNNYHKGKSNESKDGVNKLKLFYAIKSKNGKKWCPAVELPFNSDEYSVGHPSVTEDGLTLYFASDMPGGKGGSDIYMSRWDGEKWGGAENMGEQVNSPGNEFFPYIHPDGTLYYSSDGMPGLGGLDVFEVSSSDPGIPKNIGYPINTQKDDFGLILSNDGRSGYLSSNREGGEGHDDIYSFEKYFYDVKVLLVDAKTGEPLEGTINSSYVKSDKIITTTGADKELTFRVIRGDEVNLTGMKENYSKVEEKLATIDLPKEMKEPYVIKLPLMGIEKESEEQFRDVVVIENNGETTQLFAIEEELIEKEGTLASFRADMMKKGIKVMKVYTYQNILYDFDKSNIRKDAAEKLDRIIWLLNEYPTVSIKLKSHTDIRGSKSYNQELAKKRALSARTYLMKNGISRNRIIESSYGEEEVFINCKDNCNEQQHQSNRRTEILIEN